MQHMLQCVRGAYTFQVAPPGDQKFHFIVLMGSSRYLLHGGVACGGGAGMILSSTVFFPYFFSSLFEIRVSHIKFQSCSLID
jgi:hypothetical protein